MKRWDVILTGVKYVCVGGTIVGFAFVGIALPVYYSAGQETSISYVLNWI
jgi:hypothetical protein